MYNTCIDCIIWINYNHIFDRRNIYMNENIRPLHDRVVVKRTEEEKMSAGGIVIPDSATEKPARGTVVATGKGKVLDNGTVLDLGVAVGDTVLFGKFAGTEVKVSGEELVVMNEDDIMAVIES